MPPGLTFDPAPTYSTGRIEGTPTAAGWWNFYIEVTDICGSVPSQGRWSIFIHPPLMITTTSLPRATPGQAYTAKLTANSGDTSIARVAARWRRAAGRLDAEPRRDDLGHAVSGGPVHARGRGLRPQHQQNAKTLGLAVGAQLAASGPSSQRGEVGVRFRSTLQSTRRSRRRTRGRSRPGRCRAASR